MATSVKLLSTNDITVEMIGHLNSTAAVFLLLMFLVDGEERGESSRGRGRMITV